jgi:hypothetical protein
MSSSRKKAVRLGDELSDFMKDNSNERFTRGTRLQRAWEAVASTRILEHTDSVVFSTKSKQPCVIVYVESSIWAAELEAQKELYRILLEKETNWKIDDLKFYVTRKVMFKKLFKKRNSEKAQEYPESKKKKIAVPLTKEEDGYARELVSSVQDKKLQDGLYKAIKADFEWKKGSEGLKLPQKPSESPEST